MYKEKQISLQPLSTSYLRENKREQAPVQLIDPTPEERPQEAHPTWIEVNLYTIEHNCRLVASLVGPDVGILACVKANAYGHGAVLVARTALRYGADRFRRAPYNWRTVLVHEKEAPLLGNVCMDQCMIDVTHLPQAEVDDEVVLIRRQGLAALSAEEVAQRLGTIPYEVVAELLTRVPRRVYWSVR